MDIFRSVHKLSLYGFMPYGIRIFLTAPQTKDKLKGYHIYYYSRYRLKMWLEMLR